MREEGERAVQGQAQDRATFVFGVSGHRDLVPEDLPGLRKQLREIFRRHISAQPGAAFELLTPLAEGADRIAAEEALSLGIKLVVPLPMAQEEYERDFATAESLAEFRRLLSAGVVQYELTDAASLPGSDPRVQKYAAVGDHIARKSNVLILLWDGKDNQKVGGTAWVKKQREHWAWLAKESGATGVLETVHVPTRRIASRSN